MTIGLLFWILFVLAAVFGFWESKYSCGPVGRNLVLLVMLFLLGWQAFGFIVKG